MQHINHFIKIDNISSLNSYVSFHPGEKNNYTLYTKIGTYKIQFDPHINLEFYPIKGDILINNESFVSFASLP